MEPIHDLIILGAGPAGLSAAIYAGRGQLDTLLLERGAEGGQLTLTAEIENYPGQVPGDSGLSLTARMAEQAARFGAQRVSDTILSADLASPVKRLTSKKAEYLARSVILASGAVPRPIGCRNEAQYVGRGISYCATCDAGFFRGRAVYVVGGGDAAVEEALYLTRFARKVTLIHRRDTLRAARRIQAQALQNPRIQILWNTVVEEVGGGSPDLLDRMVLKNTQTGQRTVVQADPKDGFFGLFGFLGLVPDTGMFAGSLTLDENGYIVTDEEMHTNLPGVFAAGDIRRKSLRQAITAAADGAVAAVQAEQYLEDAKVQ